ncbi:hypothetical protein [Rathayibacter rathayi]|nr:hypothetical protein [Rathayibacter rathayi]
MAEGSAETGAEAESAFDVAAKVLFPPRAGTEMSGRVMSPSEPVVPV